MSQTQQTVRDKLAYGAGDIASNLFWYSTLPAGLSERRSAKWSYSRHDF
jgi:hypothetical protein